MVGLQGGPPSPIFFPPKPEYCPYREKDTSLLYIQTHIEAGFPRDASKMIVPSFIYFDKYQAHLKPDPSGVSPIYGPHWNLFQPRHSVTRDADFLPPG